MGTHSLLDASISDKSSELSDFTQVRDSESNNYLNYARVKRQPIKQKQLACDFEDCGKIYTRAFSLKNHIKSKHLGV